ncbi:hypothetical protein AGLY_008706 [Aphis glycines]|uniref:Uncharacterized protein n=1 Tax=Aphis glycines TaxID=307491 RepID=A0A6G0TJE6_APHGL|nr:hypothetical protein AGLY_008706 [Aphis glycines]
MWSTLGINSKIENFNNSFKNPFDCDRKVCLLRCATLIENTPINREFYKKNFEYDSKSLLKVCPKLTSNHFDLNNLTKMKVKYAFQCLANGIQFCKSKNYEGFTDCKETIKFIDIFNNLFDALNKKFSRKEIRKNCQDLEINNRRNKMRIAIPPVAVLLDLDYIDYKICQVLCVLMSQYSVLQCAFVQKGKEKLAFIKYMYVVHKESVARKCCKINSHKCPCILKTSQDKNRIIKIDHEHNHLLCQNEIDATKIKIKTRAKITKSTPAQLFSKTMTSLSESILEELPEEKSIKKIIQDQRTRSFSIVPENLTDLKIETKLGLTGNNTYKLYLQNNLQILMILTNICQYLNFKY